MMLTKREMHDTTEGTFKSMCIKQLVISGVFYLLIYFALTVKSNLMLVVLLYGCLYILLSDIEYGFYLIIGASVFDGALSIQGRSFTFVLLLAFIVKLLVNNHFKIKASYVSLACLAIVLMLEIVGDISFTGPLQIAINIMILLFFLLAIIEMNCIDVDVYEMILFIFLVFVFSIMYVLWTEGGFSAYLLKFTKYSWAYRFGSDQGAEVGGAMAIPLYASILFSAALVYFIQHQRISVWRKVSLCLIMGVSLLFGALTISRSFFLDIAVTIAFVLVSVRSRTIKPLITIVFVGAFVTVFALIKYPQILHQVFRLLTSRNDLNGSGGRFEIWASSAEYLLSHPIAFLIGSGSSNYPLNATLGGSINFHAGTHNLFLDLIMSWGIIGFICTIILVKESITKIRTRYGKIDLILFVPLATYGAFAMTALRSNGIRTWAFLLVTIFFIQSNMKEKHLNDT